VKARQRDEFKERLTVIGRMTSVLVLGLAGAMVYSASFNNGQVRREQHCPFKIRLLIDSWCLGSQLF